MKKEIISCDIIQDLLPLYEDGCCSEASRDLVEEHLKECKVCQEKSIRCNTDISFSEDETCDPEEKVIKKGIRRMKRIRAIGIGALLVCIAVISIIIPIVNYQMGTGITYANLKNIHIAEQFIKALEEKDYEKAYGYLNIKDRYVELVNGYYDEEAVNAGVKTIKENGLGWYDQICREKFMDNMHAIEDKGMLIRAHSFREIYKGSDEWYINFSIQTEDGTSRSLDLKVGKNGINEMSTLPFPFEYKEPDDPIELKYRYYTMPSLNETICEILYKDTDFDWKKLFN